MKKFLTVVFILALSFLISACDGDDGERGIDGLTGPSGLDDLLNPDTVYTDEQKAALALWEASMKGEEGTNGIDGCDYNQIRIDGKCEINTAYTPPTSYTLADLERDFCEAPKTKLVYNDVNRFTCVDPSA